MKTINIELNLPKEEQDLNINIVIREGGKVEINALPSTPEAIEELPVKNIVEGSNVDEKPATKKRAGKKANNNSTDSACQKKMGGNYMDMEF